MKAMVNSINALAIGRSDKAVGGLTTLMMDTIKALLLGRPDIVVERIFNQADPTHLVTDDGRQNVAMMTREGSAIRVVAVDGEKIDVSPVTRTLESTHAGQMRVLGSVAGGIDELRRIEADRLKHELSASKRMNTKPSAQPPVLYHPAGGSKW